MIHAVRHNIYGDCAIMTLVKDGLDPGHSLSQMHCVQQKKQFPLILDRGSQSYLSWFIVSLLEIVQSPSDLYFAGKHNFN